MDQKDRKNKEQPPEHVVAGMLSDEGFSIAIVGADVTLEELDAILPQKKQKNQ